VLARIGTWWLPFGDHEPGWFLRWLTFAGVGLFGLGFLIGSILAPRNPRASRIPRIETDARKLTSTGHAQGLPSSWSGKSAGFHNSGD